MSDSLDMTAMYATHDALRRDLEHIAKITAGIDDDPRRILANAAGWEMFKKALYIHHTAEDDALWPTMRQALAGRPDELILMEAMEAEHAAIDPLIDAIDAALADRDSGPERLGDLTGALTDALCGHLEHEENEALPLISATLTQQQWQHFGEVSSSRIGADASRLLPWMLDDGDEQVVARILSLLPEPMLAVYRDEWQPAFVAWDRWNAGV